MESKSEFKQRMHKRTIKEQQKLTNHLKGKYGTNYTHPLKKNRLDRESC